MKCSICMNEENNKIYNVKEMQIGLREEFEYMECSNCGVLQITNMPKNIGKYYRSNYISFNSQRFSFIKNYLKYKLWDHYAVKKSIIGKLVSFHPYYSEDIFAELWKSLFEKGILTKDSIILDVGCVSGDFLSNLKKDGFFNIEGIDLFVDKNHIHKNIKITQSALDKFSPNEYYDIITSHHSFEHMNNQLENFKQFKRLLKDNGILIIRIPLKSKYIWDKYSVNWYQIDAPRHFYLHTLKSFELLAKKAGFIIENIIFDSAYPQFTTSQQYEKDISMSDANFSLYGLDKSKLNYYKEKSKNLNQNKEGDQAIFILKQKN